MDFEGNEPISELRRSCGIVRSIDQLAITYRSRLQSVWVVTDASGMLPQKM